VKTPFESMKSMLVHAIESLKAVDEPERVESLEQSVKKFEKDIGEWRRLSQSDLTPLIEEELARLSAKMQRLHE